MLIIVDLEATCWERYTTFKKQSETIEIGACIIDENKKILSEFQSFVQPVQHSTLSDFCKELTHISQKDIDSAETFPKVLEKFLKWRGDIDIWSSWGQYDYQQILKDCYHHRILFPQMEHINLKNEVAQQLNIKKRGIGNMLKHLGMEFEGVQHRALTDVKNIVRILEKANYTMERREV